MINYDLTKIKALVFDVDGVLSGNAVNIGEAGILHRTANVKDGYALHLAAKLGLLCAIITGAEDVAVRDRYEALGLKDIYTKSAVKTRDLHDFISRHGLKLDEVLYMGDDIPDYNVMKQVGLPCCPRDAAPEIRDICIYVSTRDGGKGCARDVIEQVLKAKGLWMADQRSFEW